MSDQYMYEQAAVAVEADYGGAPQFRGKQGHTCCGCCCDTRRAVIISNLVMIIVQIITGTLLIAGVELIEAAAAQADDDQIIDAGKELQQIPMGLVVVLMLVSIALHGLGVQGAIAYQKWMVYAAMGSYALNLVVSVFQFNFFGIILNLSLVYPHFYFIKEMNEQIMTPENYPNEVASCCCV